ncbi:pygopus homolog 2 [Microcaecilia unicolor]|uniref:Pygopus homolog 2 n=1 Tax=Microcaecilia unicolor TaxID=1415580 RepID=A0A6P7WUW5_9AMPH|nr:pygopus homolog 2 [Microcaecilia unicolor]
MAAEPEKLDGGPGPGQGRRGKTGLQMKSPEKKRRKSSTQSPAYSHLSEFAPPPTPMVDHLVASNPFEDDFGVPKVGGPSAPFLNNPMPFGNFRMQGALTSQIPPGYGGGPQPIRRQPPPFPPNQMGPAFNMPPTPDYVQQGHMNFSNQPFNQAMGQGFSPPAGQMIQGPAGGFGPMMSPAMGQLPRGDIGPSPALNSSGAPALQQRFSVAGNPFGQSSMPRPNLPPNASPYAGAEQSFPLAGEETGKNLNPPSTAFSQEQHVGSPAAVNGNQRSFPPSSSTPELNNLPPSNKPAACSGLVYPCGACRNEVSDDQDAILCEASCQKWFHRECTGMTESAYGLLTTEASAVWACDYCLKTKEIQSVYIREGMGQLVVATDG